MASFVVRAAEAEVAARRSLVAGGLPGTWAR
jgi:hypothetical protein